MKICKNNTSIKGRKNTKNIRTYRPVTNIVSKILERMTNKRLVLVSEEGEKIYARPFNFRK